MLIRRTPFVLTSELYAIPALIGAIALVVLSRSGSGVTVAAVVGAALCFVIRMVGVWFGLNAPYPLAPGSCSGRRRVTVAVPVPGRQLGGCRDHQCLCRCPVSAG